MAVVGVKKINTNVAPLKYCNKKNMEKGVVIGLGCAGGVVLILVLVGFVGYKFFSRKDRETDNRRKLSNRITSDTDVHVDLTLGNGISEILATNFPTGSGQGRQRSETGSSSFVDLDGQTQGLTTDHNTSTVDKLQLFAAENNIPIKIDPRYDYPSPILKSIPSIEENIQPNTKHPRPLFSYSGFGFEENIYENLEIIENRIRQLLNDSTASTNTTIFSSQPTSYSAITFSGQNEPKSGINSGLTSPKNIKSIRKSHPIAQRLSPPISKPNANRSKRQDKNYPQSQFRNSNPRFHFPYKTLVIATDATPRHIGGYLINHFTKRVEFYSVPVSRMPWILRNRTRSGNPTEFEMKNLLIALLLWEDNIMRHKRLAIFTDNSAIIGNSLYGSRVRSFLRHLSDCNQVLHVNPEWRFVNSKESPEIFQEFIIPADQLSRLDELGFRESIMTNHYEFHEGNISHLKFNSIRHKMLYWTMNPCSNCGFHIPKSGSLKRWMQQ